jgi:hypothetical protein
MVRTTVWSFGIIHFPTVFLASGSRSTSTGRTLVESVSVRLCLNFCILRTRGRVLGLLDLALARDLEEAVSLRESVLRSFVGVQGMCGCFSANYGYSVLWCREGNVGSKATGRR